MYDFQFDRYAEKATSFKPVEHHPKPAEMSDSGSGKSVAEAITGGSG